MSHTSDDHIVVAKRLTRVYPMGSTEVVGIADISFEVRSGELVVLKGNSGSGKSTLLALLAGLDQPTRGRLTVAGHDLQRSSPPELVEYRRRMVGVVFQSFNLLSTLSVLENICLPALLAGSGFSPTRDRAMELIEWLNLKDRYRHRPVQLSGGEMQRTAIARALINNPRIILADEPTGNLDSRNGQIVIELLTELNRESNRTVIIATHSSLADPYATSRICLKDGSITERTCTA